MCIVLEHKNMTVIMVNMDRIILKYMYPPWKFQNHLLCLLWYYQHYDFSLSVSTALWFSQRNISSSTANSTPVFCITMQSDTNKQKIITTKEFSAAEWKGFDRVCTVHGSTMGYLGRNWCHLTKWTIHTNHSQPIEKTWESFKKPSFN